MDHSPYALSFAKNGKGSVDHWPPLVRTSLAVGHLATRVLAPKAPQKNGAVRRRIRIFPHLVAPCGATGWKRHSKLYQDRCIWLTSRLAARQELSGTPYCLPLRNTVMSRASRRDDTMETSQVKGVVFVSLLHGPFCCVGQCRASRRDLLIKMRSF